MTHEPVSDIPIRAIQERDNPAIAHVIRTVMPEFGASGEGFAITDPEVDCMAETYALARSAYFVVVRHDRVVGGAGIAPLAVGGDDVCELRKMYFLPEARGLGVGRALLAKCLATARDFGYGGCYLETLTGMDAAIRLYERSGFQQLDAPRGATGHFGCDRWYFLRFNAR